MDDGRIVNWGHFHYPIHKNGKNVCSICGVRLL